MVVDVRVFEVIREEERVVEKSKERLIFELHGGRWIYHAPNQQNHTEEQVEVILKKLKELNAEVTR